VRRILSGLWAETALPDWSLRRRDNDEAQQSGQSGKQLSPFPAASATPHTKSHARLDVASDVDSQAELLWRLLLEQSHYVVDGVLLVSIAFTEPLQ